MPGVSFVTAASFTLVLGLFVQTLILTIYLLWRAPKVLQSILGLWRPSLLAGFMGAFASQFWFLAFALTAAANVRTLALIEVLFAQGSGVLLVQAADRAARDLWHRADRGRRGAAGGILTRFARQFRSSGSVGSGDTSMPSSISDFASSGEASP